MIEHHPQDFSLTTSQQHKTLKLDINNSPQLLSKNQNRQPDLQMATAQTVKTQYVETNGIRYAYRKFGKATAGGIPLFMHGHFRSNM